MTAGLSAHSAAHSPGHPAEHSAAHSPSRPAVRSFADGLGVLNPAGWFGPTRPSGSGRDGRRRTADRLLDLGIYLALVALVLYFWQASPYFMTQRNLLNVGAAVAVTGVLAAGMTIALIAGQLDLTVGGNIALTSVVVSLVIEDLGWGTPLAVVVGLAVGVVIGLVNTALVVGVGINSIIATLAMGIVIRGVALISTDGQTKPLTNLALPDFLQDRPLAIPTSVWILAAVFLASWVVMTFTRAGWHIYGVGGNPSAALRAGVRTKRVYAGVFVTTGVLAALGGIITTGTSSSGGPNYANGAEFDVLTAVLLGGIGLAGGSGRVQRTLAGVLVIGVLNNGLTLMSVNSYYQQLARGAVFVLAVVLGAVGERRRAR
ncbi:ribose transport system permease protein [Actinacidiphila yanglinensis]|uniref:Ribose transport system permease protein n=1 Tax=Actinacidiphila yanglinensis TaxID=310779 RepID=A0A1H6D8Y0_9ACTN|nr:ABC transporter permease [Actinacidiphila yanglinensis]SEG81927.1 ribose transport system permease protein [Actinacidiphila yanglinensis]